jgi:hypothetical protein
MGRGEIVAKTAIVTGDFAKFGYSTVRSPPLKTRKPGGGSFAVRFLLSFSTLQRSFILPFFGDYSSVILFAIMRVLANIKTHTSSADTATANGTPKVSKCFFPQFTLSASVVRNFRKSRVLLVSLTR